MAYPFGIAIGGADLYVADTNNNRVQNFSLSGAYVLDWGTLGAGNGQFTTQTASQRTRLDTSTWSTRRTAASSCSGPTRLRSSTAHGVA